MVEIKFGTSGWRGIIAEDFTFHNLRAVAQAIAEYVIKEGGQEKGVIIGRDFRFLGEEFSREVAKIMCGNNIPVFYIKEPAPTPAISYSILSLKTAGAINITASHNSFEYTGVKFSPGWGGPALPETTRWIEARSNELVTSGHFCFRDESEAKSTGIWREMDPRGDYLAELAQKIDFDVIKSFSGRVAYDPMHSAGKNYLDGILKENGIPVTVIHDDSNPYFGGRAPDPSEKNLDELSKMVRENHEIFIGCATDGDADRFGILDRDGAFIEPNYLIALFVDYLIENRKVPHEAARSVATTHLVDAVCRYHGGTCFETPVGFKYIGEFISKNAIAAGGEESAGFSLYGHVPEKDGIIACLLAIEMVAKKKKSISELLTDLYRKVGMFRTRRVNLKLTEALEASFPEKMAAPPDTFAGIPVEKITAIDGKKFILTDGSWVLFRKSGTEPVVRIYAEARDDSALDAVVRAAEIFILR